MKKITGWFILFSLFLAWAIAAIHALGVFPTAMVIVVVVIISSLIFLAVELIASDGMRK